MRSKLGGSLRRLVGQHKPDPYGLVRIGGLERATRSKVLCLELNFFVNWIAFLFDIKILVKCGKKYTTTHLG